MIFFKFEENHVKSKKGDEDGSVYWTGETSGIFNRWCKETYN